jgi:hypothetical protein
MSVTNALLAAMTHWMHAIFHALFWMLVAALFFTALGFGSYLVFSSGDRLTIAYQNYMLRKTYLPLKDEHFSNMPTVLLNLRLLGSTLLLFNAIVLTWVIFGIIRV